MPSKLIFVFCVESYGSRYHRQTKPKIPKPSKKINRKLLDSNGNQEQCSKATWIMEIYLITTTKQWTEDVRESHKIQHICKFKFESSDVMKYKQHCLPEWLDNDWHKKEASFDTKEW